jgi:dolichol-phosphate mannosyltransferase
MAPIFTMTDSPPPPVAPIPPGTERALIVVPTYDESSNIPTLIQEFFAHAVHAHLLVVDDDSPDGTAEIVEKLMDQYPRLCLLRRKGERGLGRAYTAGIRHGLEKGFQIIGTMDADLSHNPIYLPPMLALLETCEVVIGSRYVRDGGTVNWKTGRILLSWLANTFAATLLRIPAHDVTSGYRVYRSQALEWIRTEEIKSSGYSFLAEILYRVNRAGARIVEYPIIFHDRTVGVSKLHRREIYLGALNLLRLRFSMR